MLLVRLPRRILRQEKVESTAHTCYMANKQPKLFSTFKTTLLLRSPLLLNTGTRWQRDVYQYLHEASLVPNLSPRVYNVLISAEGVLAESTYHSRVHDYTEQKRLSKQTARRSPEYILYLNSDTLPITMIKNKKT